MTTPRDPIEAPATATEALANSNLSPEYRRAFRAGWQEGRAAARDEGRQEAVREIRGRLWEWLHPQTTSDILDDVARHGSSSVGSLERPGAYEIDDGEGGAELYEAALMLYRARLSPHNREADHD